MLGRPGEDFNAWRHQQTMQCVERPGLCHCRNEDYSYVQAHMLRLQGHAKAAQAAEVRADDNTRRQALAKLRFECRNVRYIEKPYSYVKAISRRKFKTDLIETDLTAKQLWQLVFSLRSGEQRRKKKGQPHA